MSRVDRRSEHAPDRAVWFWQPAGDAQLFSEPPRPRATVERPPAAGVEVTAPAVLFGAE